MAHQHRQTRIRYSIICQDSFIPIFSFRRDQRNYISLYFSLAHLVMWVQLKRDFTTQMNAMIFINDANTALSQSQFSISTTKCCFYNTHFQFFCQPNARNNDRFHYVVCLWFAFSVQAPTLLCIYSCVCICEFICARVLYVIVEVVGWGWGGAALCSMLCYDVKWLLSVEGRFSWD